jgi:hypothetical protein
MNILIGTLPILLLIPYNAVTNSDTPVILRAHPLWVPTLPYFADWNDLLVNDALLQV